MEEVKEKEDTKTIIALIPAYEPDERLKKIVDELYLNNFKVIVVNDGSSNEYQKYFDNLKATVISYPKNMGKGYALKTGFNYINNNYNNYVVVTIDSDGQHKIEDAIKLCKYVEENPDTLVLGSRKRNKSIPIRSYLGNTITEHVYKIVTKKNIYDTQTGLRAFSSLLMPYMLKIEGNRFEYEMNVLLYSSINNIKIKEIIIETIYIDNNRKSHFNTIKDSFLIYKNIIKFSLSSITSFIIDYLLYIFIFFISSNIILANVIARVLSSIYNYNVNNKLVFKNNCGKNSLIKYYLLVIFILLINSLILLVLSKVFNIFLAKILVEIISFIISYNIQNKIIFKGSDKN